MLTGQPPFAVATRADPNYARVTKKLHT
jgi:hypothetical protein